MRISPLRSTSRPTLYRSNRWRVISVVVALGFFLQIASPPTLPAQVGHAAKTNKGPRALGLLELAPNGKARLIPIAILIDGKFYDASAYKAAPVPMALWADTVYEGIHTGVSLGLFTVTAPLQAKDGSGATVWWAEGRWQTADSIKAMAAKKKPVPSTPRGMNDDEGPPVLLRRAGGETPKPPESTSTPQPTPPASTGSPTATPSPAPAVPTSASPATVAQQEQSQDDKPPDDKDRPTLKRGQAGAVSADEAQKKVSVSTTAKAVTPAVRSANAPTMSASSSAAQPANQTQLIPAISDPHPSDSLPYTYNMTPQDEQQFRKKMLAMAADEIRARAAQLAPATTAAKPVHASPQRGKANAAKPVQPIFDDVQLQVFDLADINEPELILTAKAHMPQSSQAKNTTNSDLQYKDQQNQNKDRQYMITLVVREDVNGDLHKALANVTDTQHLDAIPRLDLIDAVDVDGDGRAELLFREVSETSSAFVVYRVIGDQLYPLFQGSL
jgi:hypothetical protein